MMNFKLPAIILGVFFFYCIFCEDDIVRFLAYSFEDSHEMITMVQDEGYPVEKYDVTTEDHYILGLYRIPSSKPNPKIILLMHGLFETATCFIVFGRKYGLGYILSDAGYDVWLGNARGTQFSRAHKYVNPNTSATYWNYSFHEIGKFDLPAMINFILTQTNGTALHYVAHSQGCTAFFVLLSLHPEYNEKIISMHAMAPAVFLSHTQAVDGMFIAFLDQLEIAFKSLGVYEVTLRRPELRGLLRMFSSVCREKTILQMLCVDAIFSSLGSNMPPLTKTMTANFLRNTPASISLKQLMHYGQLVRSGKFQLFDYKSANLQIYQQILPPKYNLSNIDTDLQIIYGSADPVVQQLDVEKLIKLCGKNVVDEILVTGANHFDFTYGENINQTVYSKIVELVNKY